MLTRNKRLPSAFLAIQGSLFITPAPLPIFPRTGNGRSDRAVYGWAFSAACHNMPPPSSRSASVLSLCCLSLTSAFLLFQVQPVMSKYILPWFGGSPGVWTTCMLFFQVVLFLGYAYAHALTLMPRRWQGLIHGLLVLGALACQPISPSDAWKPKGDEDPVWAILLLLGGTVGLPYFVLSSTSPLVQVWFARANPGGRPWRLYVLSNIGSLVALLSYPFFFEPRWDVGQQTTMWSLAFVLFVILSFLGVWQDRKHAAAPVIDTLDDGTPEHPSPWWHRVLWVLLPAMASVMLLATTNEVCQDVAVIPFMWVIPLSLYLLTFIICFEHERWYVPALWAGAAMALLFLAGGWVKITDVWDGWVKHHDALVFLKSNFVHELVFFFLAMFFGCMVCHGELTRLKPSHRLLTEFYLMMSAGGALGGLAVSLVAPHVFTTYKEWPLGLMACFLIAAIVLVRQIFRRQQRWLRYVGGITVAAFTVAGTLNLADWGFATEKRIDRVRNFYGAISVSEEYDPRLEVMFRTLSHGTITHGFQNLGEWSNVPTTYYGHNTGVGMALLTLENNPAARVGIVGMGAGTVACYGKAGQTFRFYDINPDIVKLARKDFTYLSDMEKRGTKLEVIIGDARLSLEREQPQGFNVILLDAFSGDSVPVHLLTKEAFEIYKRHLAPNGIIAVHVTNSYLRLAPVVKKVAEAIGMKTTRVETESDGDDYSTDYVLVTNNAAFLAAHPEQPSDEKPLDVNVWTDRNHNLYRILSTR